MELKNLSIRQLNNLFIEKKAKPSELYSDIFDTSFSVQLKQSCVIIKRELKDLIDKLNTKMFKPKARIILRAKKEIYPNQDIFFKDTNGELHTPIPDSFLDGITRRTVIEIAKSKNIKVHERKISPSELPNFVGCFLTGTAAEVTPVSCIAENQFKVCETIIDLNESYQALVRKKKAA